jgi:hypothetical protein
MNNPVHLHVSTSLGHLHVTFFFQGIYRIALVLLSMPRDVCSEIDSLKNECYLKMTQWGWNM